MMGAQNLLTNLPKRMGRDVRVVRASCMGGCDRAPVAFIGHRYVEQASLDKVARTVEGGDFEPEISETLDYDSYTLAGGYQLLRECLDGKRNVDNVIGIIEDSGLRGLGGAGFPGSDALHGTLHLDGCRRVGLEVEPPGGLAIISGI